MTRGALIKKIKLFDGFLLITILLALGLIFGFIRWSNPPAHRAYIGALLEFGIIDSRLTEDAYRLQTGELTHYDDLVEYCRILLRIEQHLEMLPSHVAHSDGLSEKVTTLGILLHEKLAHLEDYKTTLAALRVGTDNLPTLAEEVRKSGLSSLISLTFLAEMLDNTLVFLDDPSPRHRESVQGLLNRLNEHVAGSPPSDPPTPLEQFATAISRIVENKLKSIEQLRAMAVVQADAVVAMPLRDACAQLSYAYHLAHQKSRLRALIVLATLLTALLLLFVVLIYASRWRAIRHEAVIEEKQQSLATALKEARARTETLRHDGVQEATNLAEERLTALLKNTFETIAIISREENFIFLSPAVIRMLGLSEKELIGRSVYEGIHADDLIRVKDYFTRAQKELQTEQTISYRLMDARGKWHMVETFATNQYSNPAIRGMILNTRKLESLPTP